MLGDYTSMLLLLKHPHEQESCPSMKFESIYGFTQHCFNLPHALLKDSKGDLIQDIKGQTMEREGSVLNAVHAGQFLDCPPHLHVFIGVNVAIFVPIVQK
jgi:hypothetical protein